MASSLCTTWTEPLWRLFSRRKSTLMQRTLTWSLSLSNSTQDRESSLYKWSDSEKVLLFSGHRTGLKPLKSISQQTQCKKVKSTKPSSLMNKSPQAPEKLCPSKLRFIRTTTTTRAKASMLAASRCKSGLKAAGTLTSCTLTTKPTRVTTTTKRGVSWRFIRN